MAIELQDVLYQLTGCVMSLDNERVLNGEPAEYQSLRDAMLIVQREWQSLMKVVRTERPKTHIHNAAVDLAAAAVKLATDLAVIQKNDRQARVDNNNDDEDD